MSVTTLRPVNVMRESIAALAPLFVYPGVFYDRHLERARASAEVDGNAAESLRLFVDEVEQLGRAGLESLYTRTFDLGPTCLPYLGAHLFDAESRDRARLMVGLRMTYRNGGHESDTELPDHIAEVLRFAPKFDHEEWPELLRLVLLPALEKMNQCLAGSTNPYRHLVSAAAALSRAAAVEGGES